MRILSPHPLAQAGTSFAHPSSRLSAAVASFALALSAPDAVNPSIPSRHRPRSCPPLAKLGSPISLTLLIPGRTEFSTQSYGVQLILYKIRGNFSGHIIRARAPPVRDSLWSVHMRVPPCCVHVRCLVIGGSSRLTGRTSNLHQICTLMNLRLLLNPETRCLSDPPWRGNGGVD